MTIVEPRPLYITATSTKAKRPDVSDGQKVKVALPAEGADRLAGEVKIDLADPGRPRASSKSISTSSRTRFPIGSSPA